MIILPVKCYMLCCCCLVTQLCLTLCDPMHCITPGFPVLHCLLEFAQTHVHWVNDAIQPSHPLLPLSPSSLDLTQHQGIFQWLGSSHQMVKISELQHQFTNDYSGLISFRIDWLDLLAVCFPNQSRFFLNKI